MDERCAIWPRYSPQAPPAWYTIYSLDRLRGSSVKQLFRLRL